VAEEDESVSIWRSSQLYMGHLAVTDGRGETFHAFERFSRGGGGLAGSQASPFRAWIEDWELTGPAEEPPLPSVLEKEGGGLFPLELIAQEEGVGLALTFRPAKPLVLQGDRGLSQKGPEEGNASFYYSFTRLEALGDLLLGTDTVAVTGQAWMDREWSTSALSTGQVGWDWFALQLDDGSDLMYYQLRLEDGQADSLSKGILVEESGEGTALTSDQVALEVTHVWVSPLDGTTYPAGWDLSVPDQDLALSIEPLFPDQELNLTFRYWEGAVRVLGTRGGREVEGRGYVELTGYADTPLGSVAKLQRR
jgi:predicted secreted hydrolase